MSSLLRLRRGRIVVNVGEPFVLPGTPNKAKTEELGRYTDEIMMRMAVLAAAGVSGVLPRAGGGVGSGGVSG